MVLVAAWNPWENVLYIMFRICSNSFSLLKLWYCWKFHEICIFSIMFFFSRWLVLPGFRDAVCIDGCAMVLYRKKERTVFFLALNFKWNLFPFCKMLLPFEHETFNNVLCLGKLYNKIEQVCYICRLLLLLSNNMIILQHKLHYLLNLNLESTKNAFCIIKNKKKSFQHNKTTLCFVHSKIFVCVCVFVINQFCVQFSILKKKKK